MSGLNLMVTITERNLAERFLRFYRTKGASFSLVALGRGTAGSEVLDVLGLARTEKELLLGVVTDGVWEELRDGLENGLDLAMHGQGIAFVVPLSSVGGRRELLFLADGQDFVKGEESVLKDTVYELIVAVTNLGYSEKVMDVARSAGAGGGTILHARGTGLESAEKFFGITLASEKELVLIVARSEQREALMRAVMQEAGMASKAKTIVFSLPVTGTAGLRLPPVR